MLALPSRRLAPAWVRNDLWRRARAVPSLDLRFAENKSLADAVTGQNLITFTRASSGTFVGSDGLLKTAGTNEPRFNHNPTTGECLGLLVEEQRTNLLLNSGTLSTQSITVTAAAHTLSFTGTGTITLSGTSTAGPLVGTGTGEANRVSLTFTPTAGTLTLTVSGTVSNAQLEVGAFRTSYIPTTGSAATRNADVVSITGANYSSWANNTAFTVFSEAASSSGAAYSGYVYTIGTDFNNSVTHYRQADFQPVARIRASSVDEYGALGNGTIWTGTSRNRFALALSPTSGRQASNGSLATGPDDSSIAFPAMTSMSIGSLAGALFLNGTIGRLTYWPIRLGNNVLQAITQ